MKGSKIKLVISKTIMFLIILGFIILFKIIFGAENTLIGVTTITGALMFLERNLTTSKVRYLYEIIIINVALGVLAYVASGSAILALVCNFIAMFFIGYIFSYDVRSNMYVPFGLQYVFMLATPVEFNGMYMRILSLIFGAVFIMLVQIVVNKNKVQKEGIPALKELFKITRKILLENDKEKLNTLNKKFNVIAVKIKETIYNSKKENFHIESNEKAILDIILFLASIKGKKEIIKNDKEFLKNLKEFEKYIDMDKDLSFLSETEYIDTNIDLKTIYDLLNKTKILEKKSVKIEVPEEFKRINIVKRYLNKDSMRFRYAFRLGLSIGLAGFLVEYFNIFQGKWILFTIFALIQPYKEFAESRTKERALGTLIGAIGAFIVFTIVKNPGVQSIIVMFVGYLDSFHKTYKEKMIYVTISATGASLILGGTTKMVITRIILIFIGILISIIFNKFVMPYSIEDAKEELINMYKVNGEKIIEEIKRENKNGSLENHYIIGSLIEKKLEELNIGQSILENKSKILNEYFKFKKELFR